jgi:hypothetical protein
MSLGGSGGNLPKWLLADTAGLLYYAKGRSKHDSFEPEAEICAYKLAELFGVDAIKYELMVLPELSEQPVCVCKDYSGGQTVMSLYRYVEAVTGIDPAKLNGVDKFKLVEDVLDEKDKKLHAAILYLDYIIGNTDRHLRNFDVRVNAEGVLLELVPMFDTGACLFSSEFEAQIRMACRQSDNYVHSKPYANPHSGQLKLLKSMGYSPLLRSAKKEDIYKTINSCFTGDRAKYLGQYVILNLERLGLL